MPIRFDPNSFTPDPDDAQQEAQQPRGGPIPVSKDFVPDDPSMMPGAAPQQRPPSFTPFSMSSAVFPSAPIEDPVDQFRGVTRAAVAASDAVLAAQDVVRPYVPQPVGEFFKEERGGISEAGQWITENAPQVPVLHGLAMGLGSALNAPAVLSPYVSGFFTEPYETKTFEQAQESQAATDAEAKAFGANLGTGGRILEGGMTSLGQMVPGMLLGGVGALGAKGLVGLASKEAAKRIAISGTAPMIISAGASTGMGAYMDPNNPNNQKLVSVGSPGFSVGNGDYLAERDAERRARGREYIAEQVLAETIPPMIFSSIGLGGAEKQMSGLPKVVADLIKEKNFLQAAREMVSLGWKDAVKAAVKTPGRVIAEELPEEMITSALQTLSSAKVDPKNAPKDWTDWVKIMGETAAQTAIAAGAASAPKTFANVKDARVDSLMMADYLSEAGEGGVDEQGRPKWAGRMEKAFKAKVTKARTTVKGKKDVEGWSIEMNGRTLFVHSNSSLAEPETVEDKRGFLESAQKEHRDKDVIKLVDVALANPTEDNIEIAYQEARLAGIKPAGTSITFADAEGGGAAPVSGIVYLADPNGSAGSFDHELFHHMLPFLLNRSEYGAIVKRYGKDGKLSRDQEEAAVNDYLRVRRLQSAMMNQASAPERALWKAAQKMRRFASNMFGGIPFEQVVEGLSTGQYAQRGQYTNRDEQIARGAEEGGAPQGVEPPAPPAQPAPAPQEPAPPPAGPVIQPPVVDPGEAFAVGEQEVEAAVTAAREASRVEAERNIAEELGVKRPPTRQQQIVNDLVKNGVPYEDAIAVAAKVPPSPTEVSEAEILSRAAEAANGYPNPPAPTPEVPNAPDPVENVAVPDPATQPGTEAVVEPAPDGVPETVGAVPAQEQEAAPVAETPLTSTVAVRREAMSTIKDMGLDPDTEAKVKADFPAALRTLGKNPTPSAVRDALAKVAESYSAPNPMRETAPLSTEDMAQPTDLDERLRPERLKDTVRKDLDFGGGTRYMVTGANGVMRMAQKDRERATIGYNVAMQMTDRGEDAEKIRVATGWWKGKDDKWRYEISDRTSKVSGRVEKMSGEFVQDDGPLKNFLIHPDLFRSYPDLRDAYVLVSKGDKVTKGGALHMDDGEVDMIEVSGRDDEEVRMVMLHEVQHYIQRQEGFARGGSVAAMREETKNPSDAYRRYRNLHGEMEARDTAYRRDMTPTQRKKTPPMAKVNELEPDAVPGAAEVRYSTALSREPREQKYTPPTLTEADAKSNLAKIARHFGLTRDFRETGYILPDGKMMDLSGKRIGGSGGERQMDHRELPDLGGEERNDDMLIAKNSGAVRVDFAAGLVNFSVPLTPRQAEAVVRGMESSKPDFMSVELDDPATHNSVYYADMDGDNIPALRRSISEAGAVARGERGGESVRYSTAHRDKDYLDAVERGDMETAQRLVDEAAEAAGYTVGPVFHGTSSGKEFNTFRSRQSGIWFAFDQKDAEPGSGESANRVIRAYVDPKGTYELTEAEHREWQSSGAPLKYISDLRAKRWSPSNRIGSIKVDDYAFVVFDREQVKSADPVTRDNKGKVIPLSQRFDTASPDIRYSTAEDAPVSIRRDTGTAIVRYSSLDVVDFDSRESFYQTLTGIGVPGTAIDRLRKGQDVDKDWRDQVVGEIDAAAAGDKKVRKHGMAALKSLEKNTDWQGTVAEHLRAGGVPESDIQRAVIDIAFAAQLQRDMIDSRPDLAKGMPQKSRLTRGLMPDDGSVIKNGDYLVSWEGGGNCTLRMDVLPYLDSVTEELAARGIDADTSPAEREILHTRIVQHGMPRTCLVCYVEARRNLKGQFAGNMTRWFAEENVPAEDQTASMTKPENITLRKKDNAGFASKDVDQRVFIDDNAWQAAENDPASHLKKYEAIYRSIKSTANANASRQFGPRSYSGQWRNLTPRQKMRQAYHGGVRHYSISDFFFEHAVDLLQSVYDLAGAGANGHIYTKNPSTAMLLAKSGMKVNLSVMMRPSKDGSFNEWNGQSFPWSEAKRLTKTTENMGAVFIAPNDAAIKWAKEQDWIRYCIPLHRSGMDTAIWAPYSRMQNAQNYENSAEIDVSIEGWVGPDGKPLGKMTQKSEQRAMIVDPAKWEVFEKEFVARFGKEAGHAIYKIGWRSMREDGSIAPMTDEQIVRNTLEDAGKYGFVPQFYRFMRNEDGSIDPRGAMLLKDVARTDTEQRATRPDFDMGVYQDLLWAWTKMGSSERKANPSLVSKISDDIAEWRKSLEDEMNKPYSGMPDAAAIARMEDGKAKAKAIKKRDKAVKERKESVEIRLVKTLLEEQVRYAEDPNALSDATPTAQSLIKNEDGSLKFSTSTVPDGPRRKYQSSAYAALMRHGVDDPAYKTEMIAAHGPGVEQYLPAFKKEYEERMAEINRRAQAAAASEPPATPPRPDLGNIGDTPEKKKMMDAGDAQRPQPEMTIAEMESAGKAWVDEVGEAEAERIVRAKALAGTPLTAEETTGARIVYNSLAARAAQSGVLADHIRTQEFGYAYRDTGSSLSQAMNARRMLEESDTAAAASLLEEVLSPGKKLQRKIDKTRAALKNGRATQQSITRNKRHLAKHTRDAAAEGLRRAEGLKREGWKLTPEGMAVVAKNEDLRRRLHKRVYADKTTIWDKIFEFRQAMMLTMPLTHIKNIVSSPVLAAVELGPQRALEASLNVFARSPEGATLGELPVILRAALRRGLYAQAARNALRSFITEQQVFAEMLPQERTNSERPSQRFRDERGGAIKGMKGQVIRTSLNALGAEDDMFRTVIATVEASAQAYRIATAAGLRGKARKERMDALVADMGSDAWKAAAETADRILFTEDGGKVQQYVGGLRDVIPGLRYIVPFYKTPANLFRIGIRKGGGAPIALGMDFARGASPDQKLRHAAETIMATAFWFGISELLKGAVGGDDPWLTGANPVGGADSPWAVAPYEVPPNSIKIDGQWYDYRVIEPMGTALSLLVTTAETLHKARTSGEYSKAAMDGMKKFNLQFLEQPMLKGLKDVVDAMSAPDRKGQQLASSMITGFAPNVMRGMARNADPLVRERAGSTLWEKLQYDLLPTSDKMPPKVDVFGSEVRKGGDAVSRSLNPMRVTKPRDTDYVTGEVSYLIQRFNAANPDSPFKPAPPTDKITEDGETYTLTPDEATEYKFRAGEYASKGLAGILSRLNVDDPTDRDIEMIERQISRGRDRARKEILRSIRSSR